MDSLPNDLETYGKGWSNPELGDPRDPDAPLSLRQKAKIRQIRRLLKLRMEKSDARRNPASIPKP